jgi:hypothetical protein
MQVSQHLITSPRVAAVLLAAAGVVPVAVLLREQVERGEPVGAAPVAVQLDDLGWVPADAALVVLVP